MDTKRKWQWALILAVMGLTLYNILPTLFYYANPLSEKIGPATAAKIGQEIAQRVDQMEQDSLDWLGSYCKLHKITPASIEVHPNDPSLIILSFAKTNEATTLRKGLLRAGSLIPWSPAQLKVLPEADNPKEIFLQRKISFRSSEFPTESLFEYVEKGAPHIEARKKSLQQGLKSAPDLARSILYWSQEKNGANRRELLLSIGNSIAELAKFYDAKPSFAKRLAAQIGSEKEISALPAAFANLRDEIKKEPPHPSKDRQELKLAAAERFLKQHGTLFAPQEKERGHPFFKEPRIQESSYELILSLQSDLETPFESKELQQLLDQWMTHEIARLTHTTHETFHPCSEGFRIPLQKMSGVTGFLTLNLELIGKKQAADLLQTLKTQWHPQHPDLAGLPIFSVEEFRQATPSQQALCLVVSAPVSDPLPALKEDSIYAVAIGLEKIARSYQGMSEAPMAQLFAKDFQKLAQLLYQRGMSATFIPEYGHELIFEKRNFYEPLLAATREEFHVFGSPKRAFLELSNVEQRIITQNKIETQFQEDLLKWSDEYRAAQVSLNDSTRYEIPPPTRSVFWSNLKLSLRKFWRGDERKILRWGLDLSGGKTVQIELRDGKNRVVTEESDIKQGINELFQRVNKMGASDVSIRQVGPHIVLDFPGGQALSARDLVQASSMQFHVVNEEYGFGNPLLANATQQFLTEVWNEAVVTGKKDPYSIQSIAYRHLHEDGGSESARTLLENGLKLAHPQNEATSSAYDTTLSKVALFRNALPGATHPLLFVFAHHALEGSNLVNVRSNYDPSKGNYLSFEVEWPAQSDFYAWTLPFSKEKISGTPKEKYTQGHGWRMAVLLNGTLISAPSLESPLKDSASISGNFSMREIQQLVSDLRAGSLSFTPHILSEKNVSPELGQSDRQSGILAAFAATFLVILSMIAYYRFAGWIASIAVLFNLFMLWATLQNLGASLSLAGIAGVILTVGMAVDANVLVFERVKEEFAKSGKLGAALHAGYEKAFSAILDSNVTTIIAALILLNFDAGPIKAFAVSMIIGIASSMFTALFMTRFYFEGWLKKKKAEKLTMSSWVRSSKFQFLSKAKPLFICSILLVGVGVSLLWLHRGSIMGMDFTGGHALHIEVASTLQEPAAAVEKALLQSGLERSDFQIRQHDPETHLRILLGSSLEEKGKPFHSIPSSEKRERIDWITQSLAKGAVPLASSMESLESEWTSVSGQMSESMRNHALIGLLLAFGAIFIYITFRFEFQYAIAALLCLLHDLLVTLGVMGILHALGVSIQIELNTIAALMTIIGYSLNDTIIIFDRVREDIRLQGTLPMEEIVNRALNGTLSRTAITSGTTLIAILALLFLGGPSLFTFSLVMAIGVIFGTLSSWFIACPLMLFFHRREAAPPLRLEDRA